MYITIFADGGSRGNPGPAAGGAVLYDANSREVKRVGKYLGEATNNVAEYTGIIIGLEAAKELGASEVAVRMDSELVIKQLRGEYRVKHPNLQPLYVQVMRLAGGFQRVEWRHIPRAQNAAADAMVNEVLDRAIL